MKIDEAIKHAEELAEENQRVVDTGIVCGDVTIDMLFCDDTEMIEEHLANYQKCAETHRQLAEWLKELKAYKKAEKEIEQELVNWDDIDNGKCRGLFLATSIIQHYKDEEVNADDCSKHS